MICFLILKLYIFKSAKNNTNATSSIILELSEQRKQARQAVIQIKRQEASINKTKFYNDNDIMASDEAANDKQFAKLISETRKTNMEGILHG